MLSFFIMDDFKQEEHQIIKNENVLSQILDQPDDPLSEEEEVALKLETAQVQGIIEKIVNQPEDGSLELAYQGLRELIDIDFNSYDNVLEIFEELSFFLYLNEYLVLEGDGTNGFKMAILEMLYKITSKDDIFAKPIIDSPLIGTLVAQHETYPIEIREIMSGIVFNIISDAPVNSLIDALHSDIQITLLESAATDPTPTLQTYNLKSVASMLGKIFESGESFEIDPSSSTATLIAALHVCETLMEDEEANPLINALKVLSFYFAVFAPAEIGDDQFDFLLDFLKSALDIQLGPTLRVISRVFGSLEVPVLLMRLKAFIKLPELLADLPGLPNDAQIAGIRLMMQILIKTDGMDGFPPMIPELDAVAGVIKELCFAAQKVLVSTITLFSPSSNVELVCHMVENGFIGGLFNLLSIEDEDMNLKIVEYLLECANRLESEGLINVLDDHPDTPDWLQILEEVDESDSDLITQLREFLVSRT